MSRIVCCVVPRMYWREVGMFHIVCCVVPRMYWREVGMFHIVCCVVPRMYWWEVGMSRIVCSMEPRMSRQEIWHLESVPCGFTNPNSFHIGGVVVKGSRGLLTQQKPIMAHVHMVTKSLMGRGNSYCNQCKKYNSNLTTYIKEKSKYSCAK